MQTARPPTVIGQPRAEPRKLLVTMHVDMVGYSRLIGRDAAATFLRLRMLRRDVIDPVLVRDGGTLRQTAGDSLLVVFDSIDGAVDAALAIQRGIATFENDDNEEPMRFRIGINLGDAILDDSDMHGDGVNIAVRLQTACPPGRVCVSRAIRDHAMARDGLRFEPLGPLKLKNIARPVEAFLLRVEDAPRGAAAGAWRRLADAIPAWRVKRTYAALAAAVPVAALFATLVLGYRGAGLPEAQREQAAREQARHTEEMQQLAALSASQKALADTMVQEKGVPLPVIVRILARLGETVTPGEALLPGAVTDLQKRLEEKADQFVALRQQLGQLTLEDPKVADLRAQAEAALAAADFPHAEDKLHEAAAIELSAASAITERAHARATTAAGLFQKSANAAAITLHYRDAAGDFEKAADAVASFDRRQRWRYEMERASMFAKQGNEFGDNSALAEAIGVYTGALSLVPRAQYPLDWARTTNRLGRAEFFLGQRESSPERLESAAAQFRAALEEQQRDRTPLDWADSQDGLGTALWRRGERDTGTVRLEEAVAAFRAALEVRVRDRMPLAWATTQRHLAAALWDLGLRDGGTEHLTEAIAALRVALDVVSRDRAPLDWAALENNLGVTLVTLGAREPTTARLEEGLAAYRAALEEWRRNRVPLAWALAQDNVGYALTMLGTREGGTARLEEAVAAYRLVLEERTRDRVPLGWAQTQNELGNALTALGTREGGTARLEEAVAAYRLALEERTRDRVPLEWAATQNKLGNALSALGTREGGIELLGEAVAAYTASLSVTEVPSSDEGVRVALAQRAAAQQEIARRLGGSH